MTSAPPDKLLTAEEAAQVLQVSKARLYRMAGEGQLRYVPYRQHGMRFAHVELVSYQLHATAGAAQLQLPKAAPRKSKHQAPAPLIDTAPADTLTATQAAKYLGMKLDTFYWRVRHGQIACLPPLTGQRGKRFRISDLDAYRQGENESRERIADDDHLRKK